MVINWRKYWVWRREREDEMKKISSDTLSNTHAVVPVLPMVVSAFGTSLHFIFIPFEIEKEESTIKTAICIGMMFLQCYTVLHIFSYVSHAHLPWGLNTRTRATKSFIPCSLPLTAILKFLHVITKLQQLKGQTNQSQKKRALVTMTTVDGSWSSVDMLALSFTCVLVLVALSQFFEYHNTSYQGHTPKDLRNLEPEILKTNVFNESKVSERSSCHYTVITSGKILLWSIYLLKSLWGLSWK